MRSTEVTAIGELAGRTLAGAGAMVRDLHYGSCAEEDWCDCDPDELLNHPAVYDQIRAWI